MLFLTHFYVRNDGICGYRILDTDDNSEEYIDDNKLEEAKKLGLRFINPLNEFKGTYVEHEINGDYVYFIEYVRSTLTLVVYNLKTGESQVKKYSPKFNKRPPIVDKYGVSCYVWNGKLSVNLMDKHYFREDRDATFSGYIELNGGWLMDNITRFTLN